MPPPPTPEATQIDLATWERRPLFDFFSPFTEPFHGVCLRVDCTEAFRFAKDSRLSVFLTLMHRYLVAPTCIETASELHPFWRPTDPVCRHVSTSTAFETLPSSAQDAVRDRITHSNPIGPHRIRHATGFLQTPLSKLPRQSARPLPTSCAGQH